MKNSKPFGPCWAGGNIIGFRSCELNDTCTWNSFIPARCLEALKVPEHPPPAPALPPLADGG